MILFLLLIFFQDSVSHKTLVEGNGIAASAGTRLTVHYIGRLEDGTEIDNSYKRKRPYSIILNQSSVIQGWHIGLQGVKKGEKRLLEIPAKYAYGSVSKGNIPANSKLEFEIEVLDLIEPDRGWEIAAETKEIRLDSVSYFLIKEGQGVGAKDGDKLHYHYDLFDQMGLKIFSTKQDRKMEKIQLGKSKHMFKGFEKALYGMKRGGKRKIVIPTPFSDEKGYYTFDVELLKIK